MPISRLCPSVPQIVACTQNDQTGSKAVSGRPKGSPQLNRWSRARAVRSGKKLDRSSLRTQPPEPNTPLSQFPLPVDADDAANLDGADLMTVKSIYMVSDGTGWTAEHCVNAALGQFDYCLVDRGCPVSTHLFSGNIRSARTKTMGLSSDGRSIYSEMSYVRQELEFAGRLFAQNPHWPVIDVTGKAIEETAAVLLRLYHDRKNKCTMSRISKRY